MCAFAATASYFTCAVISNTVSLGVATDTLWHDVKINTAIPRYVVFDGAQQSFVSIDTPSPSITAILFGRINLTGAFIDKGLCRISTFSVYSLTSNTFLVDFIPVRKDGVGYMYDKVSRNLFGN